MIGSAAEPRGRPLEILRYAAAFDRHPAQRGRVLRGGGGGHAEPPQCVFVVAWDSPSAREELPQAVLRLAVPLVGGKAVPADRLIDVRRHAESFRIEDSDIVLRFGAALFGGRFPFLHCRLVVTPAECLQPGLAIRKHRHAKSGTTQQRPPRVLHPDMSHNCPPFPEFPALYERISQRRTDGHIELDETTVGERMNV
nr:hypothetical protein [uncultured bacterium]